MITNREEDASTEEAAGGFQLVPSYPHGEHVLAVREGALVLEQLQVDLADVVLQVEGGGEVGLAVVPRTHQHRLVGGVEPLVAPHSVHLLELLLADLAGKGGCKKHTREENTSNQQFVESFGKWLASHLGVWPCASAACSRRPQSPGSCHGDNGNLQRAQRDFRDTLLRDPLFNFSR